MENNPTEKFKVWWDEEKQLVRTKFWGPQDEAEAQGALDEIKRIIENKVNQTLLLLGDLSEASSATSRARKKYVEIAKLPQFKKQAYFGAPILTRVITSFVLSFAGVTSNKYFTTEEEAVKWLKEK